MQQLHHSRLNSNIIWSETNFPSTLPSCRRNHQILELQNCWLHQLLRNSAPTRLRRRCFSTRRPRANYRDFGLSGHILRELVHEGLLPGATRSSCNPRTVHLPFCYKWFILFVQIWWRGTFKVRLGFECAIKSLPSCLELLQLQNCWLHKDCCYLSEKHI
ncbi:ribosomal protein S14p/S29e [Medicago truncatula]|uniref:Ribosomal protein S14p/S29e n=1 Tax=Medicago truncatula TaxID=3880 RepID=G7KAD1_MEDTR|nr:ribosomal protein S14p/S29e [Medicago truncatula]